MHAETLRKEHTLQRVREQGKVPAGAERFRKIRNVRKLLFTFRHYSDLSDYARSRFGQYSIAFSRNTFTSQKKKKLVHENFCRMYATNSVISIFNMIF